MPTKQTRVSVTLNNETEIALSYLSNKSHQSMSRIAFELIQEALELREDLYLSKLADDRLINSINERIPAEDVWKKIDLE